MRDTTATLEMLQKTAQAVNSVLHEPEIIDALLDQVIAIPGARAAVVRLLSPDGDQLLQAGARELSDAYLSKGPVRVAENAIDQRILAGETVIIPDVTQDRNVQ